HRDGIRVIYYVSPQVWAWRRYRVRALRRDVDRMLVILPFEVPFYAGQGIDVEYVGHPLVDAVKMTATRSEFCHRHHLDPGRPIIALLPGSRHKEIHYHVPVMIDAARRLRELRIADYALRSCEANLHTKPDPAKAVPDLQTTITGESEMEGLAAAHQPSAIGNTQFVLPLASTVNRDTVAAIIARDASAPDVTL